MLFRSGNRAFADCVNITGITLSEGIEAIGEAAFGANQLLKSLVIPDSVTSMGRNAFSYLGSLESVTIPYLDNTFTAYFSGLNSNNSLKQITVTGDIISNNGYPINEIFANLTAVEEVKILGSCETLGERAFKGCTSLKSVTLPKDLKQISNEAFFGCTALEGIHIPKGVTTVGGFVFFNCINLKTIFLPSSVTVISDGGIMGHIDLVIRTDAASADDLPEQWAKVVGIPKVYGVES